MSEKKKFLLRLDPALYAAVEKWAADELRSVNAQIEFVLQEAARRGSRLQKGGPDEGPPADPLAGTGLQPLPADGPAHD